jgi:hypothetical protein
LQVVVALDSPDLITHRWHLIDFLSDRTPSVKRHIASRAITNDTRTEREGEKGGNDLSSAQGLVSLLSCAGNVRSSRVEAS